MLVVLRGTRMGALVALVVTACATAGGPVGGVELAPPQPVHGDDLAIAWPFTVVHGGGPETVADFHLRIEAGGELLGVRPDRENPDPGAVYAWRGEVRGGEGYWLGDPLAPGGSVTLTLLVRPQPGGDPRLNVVHWPTDGRDRPVGPRTCEVWWYDVGRGKVEREPC